jgi:hypothetical protein
MRKEIDWEKQARRDFDPVKVWNHAMRHSFQELPPDALRRKERAQKLTAEILKKDPDYFKKLSAKAHEKSRENR